LVKVRVSYLSILRDVTDRRDEELEIPNGSTVKGLISTLLEKYGEKLRPFLDPEADLGPGIILALNGELLSKSDYDRVIPDGAEFLVGLPPFGG
jgi:molybdopterin converting factor small subunit